MRSYSHYYHSALYRALHSDFWRLELTIWLQTLAWSLIGIFAPILMLQDGYSLGAVIAYFLIFFGLDVPLNFVARRLVMAWGAKIVTSLGIIAAVLFALLFHLLSSHTWRALILLAVIRAVYDTCYWVGHVYLFIESSGKPETAGKKIGIVSGVRIFAGMLGPAVGALILLLGGQEILLPVAACVFALSAIPLFTLRHVHDKPKASMPFRDFMSESRERGDYLALGLYSLHATVDSDIWPIFIFVTLGTLNSVALLAAVVSMSTIVLSYVAGSATRERSAMLVSVGGIAAAAIWILRLAVPNPALYYVSVFFLGYFGILMSVPIESSIVARGRVRDALWASTMHNASSMAVPLILFAALLPLVAVFKVSFVLAALSLFALVFVVRQFAPPVPEGAYE